MVPGMKSKHILIPISYVNHISMGHFSPKFSSCTCKPLVCMSSVHRGEAAAVFKHHTAPVTSVEWHPTDSTVFASAGDDNQVSGSHPTQSHSLDTLTSVVTLISHTHTHTHITPTSITPSQVVQWDLAVEKEESGGDQTSVDVPPQLLFIHQGQQEIKELHWHPQLPGVLFSTASNGFNVFKTISV